MKIEETPAPVTRELAIETVSHFKSSASGVLVSLRELALVACVAALARLPWIFMIPITEAPDEHCHNWVAMFLFEHNRLPHMKEVMDAGMLGVYGSLPQLGYLPHVITAHLTPFADLPFAFRVASSLLGIATVVIAYLAACELFRKDRVSRLALPLVVALHPQLVFVNSYTNSDSTIALLGAAITLVCIRLVTRGLSRTDSALLGVLLGLVALSKYSAYSVFFLAAIAFIASCCLHATTSVMILQCTGFLFFACAGSCGWWFVRQLHEYPSDLLGTKTMYKTWASTFHKPLEFKVALMNIIAMPAYWQMKFSSFWGLFGGLNRYLWQPLYIAYGVISGLAVACGLSKARLLPRVFGAVGQLGARQPLEPESEQLLQRAALVVAFVVAFLANICSMVWAASVNLGLAQGRYLFGIELPIMLLIIFGLRCLGEKNGDRAIILFVVLNALALAYQLVVLYPIYGFRIV